jgi:hypothetical protein
MQNNVGIYASQISGHLYGGPYGAYDSLATVTLSSSASSITFAGIPSGYKHLQIRGIARSTRSDQNGSFANVIFNNDTTANYSWHFLNGNGSSASALGRSSQNAIEVDRWATSLVTANTYGSIIIDILDYANVTKNKTLRYLGGYDGNGNGEIYLGSGAWLNSSTGISSITLTEGSGNFTANTQFALYGIK